MEMEEDNASQLQHVNPAPVRMSNLDLINDCDSFPYPETDPELFSQYLSTYYMFYIPPCSRPLGYVLPSVALTLKGIDGWAVDEAERTLTLALHSPKRHSALTTRNQDDMIPETESSASQLTGEQQRSAVIAYTLAAMRETGHFEVLKKWRGELYPIYWKPPSTPADRSQSSSKYGGTDTLSSNTASVEGKAELLASMERSASPLFGIVTYGCHLTAYVRRSSSVQLGAPSSIDTSTYDDMAIWVPRRARTKGTYPGMLDQTVAGGIPTGETSMESLVREASEEASLPEELVRRKARAVGTVTYFHIRDERAGGETRLMQPECQYCYDLDLTGETREDGSEVQPKPNDDEVESFELMDMEETKAALANGEFKPNCALVLLDFLVRHGVITAENEPHYNEIVSRLRRRLDFPTS